MKIKVLSKKVTITKENGKENTFYRYFTPVKIQVIDENGNDCGIQKKSLSVHFTKDAMKKIDDEKIFAFIETEKADDISLPYVYKVKKDEKTGELVYPEVWIRDFKSLTPIPYTPAENTCVPLLDEEDSEPVEIVE